MKGMDQMSYFELDIADVQEPSLSVLRTALAHARQHGESHHHRIPLEDFYRKVGFPEEVDRHEFMGTVTEVMKVAVFSRDFQPGALRGWPALETHFEFAVCEFATGASEFT